MEHQGRARDLHVLETVSRLTDIAKALKPLLPGWIEHYGRYAPSALRPLHQYLNATLLGWARRKFKRFKSRKIQAGGFLGKLARKRADLIVHWRLGMTSGFI